MADIHFSISSCLHSERFTLSRKTLYCVFWVSWKFSVQSARTLNCSLCISIPPESLLVASHRYYHYRAITGFWFLLSLYFLWYHHLSSLHRCSCSVTNIIHNEYKIYYKNQKKKSFLVIDHWSIDILNLFKYDHSIKDYVNGSIDQYVNNQWLKKDVFICNILLLYIYILIHLIMNNIIIDILVFCDWLLYIQWSVLCLFCCTKKHFNSFFLLLIHLSLSHKLRKTYQRLLKRKALQSRRWLNLQCKRIFKQLSL